MNEKYQILKRGFLFFKNIFVPDKNVLKNTHGEK
jgi:hypothetical protein